MTKVRVQDATKELSAGAGRLLETITKSRRQTLDALQTLRRLEEGVLLKEKERAELKAQEETQRQKEAVSSFMNAYSSEQPVSEPEKVEHAAEKPAPEPKPAPQPEPEQKPEPRPEPKPELAPQSEPEKPVAPAPKAPEISSAAPEAPRAQPFARPIRPAQPQSDLSARPPRPPMPPRPAQPGQPQQYGRPVNPGQPPYGRPVNPPAAGQQPYGRPVNPPAAGQQPYGRPVNPGQPPYGRPVNPPAAGQQPYGRPVNPGQPPFARPAAPGQAPMGGPGAPRKFGPRPAGGPGAPRPGGGGFGRKAGPELTPTVEKERVSNYDPNKKNYVRQTDPERIARNRRQLARENGISDDDMARGKRKKKGLQPKYRPDPIVIEKAYMTAETISVKELCDRIGKPAGEIIKKLLLLGIVATINEELSFDTAQLICNEFGIEFEMKLDKTAEDVLSDENFDDTDEDLQPRNPVVTIMGHVDHGKTSLLDYIRNTRVTAGEAGGITQHIGAYTVDVKDQQITFLDTPGHEAFTAMRARGAQVTDIAVLVVAADDGVMPQTIEAINHAKAAGVSTIIAINKIDKPNANPDRVRQELTEYGLVAEEWGGDTIMVPVSAVTGQNVDTLLEMILLVAEVHDYKANPNRKARGAIIEAKLDKSRGPVATVLVQNGTLQIGDTIVAGTAYGRVRAMVNDRGDRVKSAGPSQPVEVIGFNDVPAAGDTISAVDDDKLSRQVAEERKDKLRAALVKNLSKTSLDDLFNQISAGQIKDLNLIIKADVQGSAEAVKQSLEKISNEEVRVRVIHSAVGAITESDIMLASASGAVIIGFNVRHDASVREIAEREKVDVRLYRVIYNAIEDVEAAMKGMLAPTFKETVLGRAQVRQTFKVTGVGVIAGSYVTEGKIVRNAKARLLRDNAVVHEAVIESLKRFKDDAREVAAGFECGIGLENYNDVKENDVIECYMVEEVER